MARKVRPKMHDPELERAMEALERAFFRAGLLGQPHEEKCPARNGGECRCKRRPS